ncbi:MAG: anti-sigma factor family protein [Cyclobacteriaceae bacterium]
MEYKPEESVLMAYLYGELESEECKKVEQYLVDHPKVKEEIDQLRGVRSVLQQWPDQEVVAPIVLPANSDRTIFRQLIPWLSMAAACLLLFLAGYASGTQINYNDGELRISFNGNSPRVAEAGLSKEDVNEMIQVALKSQTQDFEQQLAQLGSREAASPGDGSSQNVQAVASWDRTMKQIQAQNLSTMNRMLEATSEQQQVYTQAMLTQFGDYLEERRSQDLQAIQSNFVELQENVALRQSETDQLLTSLVTSTKERNQY